MRIVVAVIVALGLTACGSQDEEPSPVAERTMSSIATSSTTTSTTMPSTTTTDAPPQRDPAQRYRVSTLVLENESHGPQLCLGGVATSYPPQCGGPSVSNWSWDDVEGEESAMGTTWGDATVVGTYDADERVFTLTERPGPPGPGEPAEQTDFSPACSEPDGDPAADPNSFRDPEDPAVVAVWVWSAEPPVISVVVRPGHADRVRAKVREHWTGLLCVVERDQPTREELRALHDRVRAEADEGPLGGLFFSSTDEMKGVVVVGCALADEVSTTWARERWGPMVVLDGLLEPVS